MAVSGASHRKEISRQPGEWELGVREENRQILPNHKFDPIPEMQNSDQPEPISIPAKRLESCDGNGNVEP